MPRGSYLYIFSSTDQTRNNDVIHRFRQDSNFWYFTGINQSGCLFVMMKDEDGIVSEIVLTELSSPFSELWGGQKLTVDQVMEVSGIPEVVATDNNQFEYMEKLAGDFTEFDLLGKYGHNGKMEVALLRLIKSEWEIEQMKIAAQISLEAHTFAFTNLRNRIDHGETCFEYEFQADLEYIWNQKGLTWSYYPIVAGGDRAAKYLHYGENNREILEGDLLLVDAACEHNYYASDITRTYTVSGVYTESQRQIYDIVFGAQQASIDYLRAGGRSKAEFHLVGVRFLAQKLLDLGVLGGDIESQMTQYSMLRKSRDWKVGVNNIYTYFPHGTGHYIGLDVHDVGAGVDQLESGMCLTVEPGLYFHPDDESIPKQYQGIGVRIEDCVVVRESGVEVISRS